MRPSTNSSSEVRIMTDNINLRVVSESQSSQNNIAITQQIIHVHNKNLPLNSKPSTTTKKAQNNLHFSNSSS